MLSVGLRTGIAPHRSAGLFSVSYTFPGSGALSGNWTSVQLDGAGAVKEYTNHFGPDGVAGDTYAFWNAHSFANNQKSTMTLDVLGTTSSLVGLVVRASGGNNCYMLRVGKVFGVARRDVFSVVSGTATSLYSDSTSATPGDVYTLSAVGTTITFKVNGSTVFTTMNSAVASGKPGIFTWCDTGETSARASAWTGEEV